jgi:hypothetical protein
MSRQYQSALTFSSEWNEVKEDPDYVYYNADIINNGAQADPTGVDKADPQVRFNETRDSPIISDASKYNFSIIRFSMNGVGRDLPIFIPVMRTGSANTLNSVNMLAYDAGLSVTVSYTVGVLTRTNTFRSSKPVIYSPEVQYLPFAPVPDVITVQNGQDLSTRYYWVNTISHWVNLVNATYEAAWDEINLAFQLWYVAQFGGVAPNLTTLPPRITYNPSTNLFSIYADAYGFGDNEGDPVSNPLPNQTSANFRTSAGSAADENFSMWMDANLFGMFANFDNRYLNLGNNFTYKVVVSPIAGIYQNTQAVSSPPLTAAKSFYVMVQDHPSVSSLWSPVASIVFTSGTIPLVFEQTGDPVRFGEGNVGSIYSGQAAFAPIISDVQLYNTGAFDYRDFFQYAPSAEYRLSSFQKSKTPITQIDIQVFWKNRLDGKLYPLQMYNLSTVSIKIMFRRRGVGDYPHPARKDPMNY